MKKKNGNEQLKILTNQNNSGITLLVLVITIIIMIILAGATIAVLNNTDMIKMTKETANDYEKEEEKEQIRIAFANQLLKHQEVIFEDFKNELEKTNSNFNVYGEEEKVIIDSSKTDTRYVIDLDTGEVIEMGGTGNNPINPEKTYQIRYDGNGADGGSMGTISYKLPGAKTVKENQYTKTGYTFSGWNTESNGTGTSYGVGEKINLTESPITLYAMWTLKTYNVTFTASGISGATVSTNTLSIPHGSTYRAEGNTLRFSNGQTVTATAPEQTGYTNSLTWSSNSGTITQNTTITANFTRTINKYTVTIKTNGYGTVSKTELSVPYGTTFGPGQGAPTFGGLLAFSDGQTVTATPTGLDGHTTIFDGWTPNSGTITQNTTITANFTRTINNYVVTINKSGDGTLSKTSVTVPYGTIYETNGTTLTFKNGSTVIDTVTATPTSSTGYTNALSWSSASGSVSNTMTITASFTKTANKYTVNYYNGNTKLGSSTHTYGVSSNLRTISNLNGSKSGWNFDGWTTSTSSTIRNYSDGGRVSNLTSTANGTVNLYAIWRRDANFYSYSPIITYSVISGGHPYPDMIDFKGVPTGWTLYCSKDNSTWMNYDDMGVLEKDLSNWTTIYVKMVKGNKTLDYGAIYAKNMSETKYEAKSGKFVETVLQYYNSKGYYKLTTPATAGDIDSWTFMGWRIDTSASTQTVNKDASYTGSSSTFYAVYKRTLTVSYNANGGTGTVSPQTSTQYYNTYGNITSPTFTLKTNTFTKTGYEFNEWADGSAYGTKVAAGTRITFAPEVYDNTTRKTYYATWKMLPTMNYSLSQSGTGMWRLTLSTDITTSRITISNFNENWESYNSGMEVSYNTNSSYNGKVFIRVYNDNGTYSYGIINLTSGISGTVTMDASRPF